MGAPSYCARTEEEQEEQEEQQKQEEQEVDGEQEEDQEEEQEEEQEEPELEEQRNQHTRKKPRTLMSRECASATSFFFLFSFQNRQYTVPGY